MCMWWYICTTALEGLVASTKAETHACPATPQYPKNESNQKTRTSMHRVAGELAGGSDLGSFPGSPPWE